eukprot:Sspe_Gene.67557::Locus_39855_Transcript_1_1_Confidence_1.000_Length_1017::g.67557::m.67557
MVSPGKKFLYFAFRQLRRLPKEWQPHYRYELINQVNNHRDPHNEVVPYLADKPEFWTLNYLRHGYHGVKWVLSRFGLDCPPLPQEFASVHNTIFTNETSQGIYVKRKRNTLLGEDDPFMQVRTMSLAEGATYSPRAASLEGVAKNLSFYEREAEHRLVDPSEMDEEDLEDEEMMEAETGGLVLGPHTGEQSDGTFNVDESVWHPNMAKPIDEKSLRAYNAVPKLKEGESYDQYVDRFQRAQPHETSTAPNHSLFRRWVRGPDGQWVRQKPFVPPPAVHHPMPPGFDNDY